MLVVVLVVSVSVSVVGTAYGTEVTMVLMDVVKTVETLVVLVV